MNRTNKALIVSAALLILTLAGTACSRGGGGDSPAPSASTGPSASVTSAPSESASPSASPEVLSGTGEFVGLADGHSVEIKTDSGPTAFQIDPDTEELVSDWKEGTKVRFEYTEKTIDSNGETIKQYTLMKIEKQ
jgi:hypothetical protein